MQNLTKENFWLELNENFPDAMKMFRKWIDEYKAKVGWGDLFPNGVKFHDLPFEMQNGILARFDIECNNGVFTGRGSAIYESQRPVYVSGFYSLFADLQRQLNKQNQ